jgi:hypothetical protein
MGANMGTNRRSRNSAVISAAARGKYLREEEERGSPGEAPAPLPLPVLGRQPTRAAYRGTELRRALRAARRCLRRLMPRVPPPVCGPAFGSCSGGASGGDAWASASDTVNTVTSAGAAAKLNAARGRRESALRREITSDVLLIISPWYEVDEKPANRAYRDHPIK